MTLLKNIRNRKENSLALVHLMIDERNHGLSLKHILIAVETFTTNYKNKRPRITRCQQQDQTMLEKIKEIVLQRPSYGTRRMAAMLTRVLGKSIDMGYRRYTIS